MQDDFPPPPSKRGFPVLGCLLIVVGLSLFCVLLLASAYWWWSARSASLVQVELDRLRDAGEPVSAEDMHAFYPAPAADADCTDLWLRATRVFDGPAYTKACDQLPVVGVDREIPPPGEPWPEEAAVEELLARYAESMDLMHEAARYGGEARYPVDFQGEFLEHLNHLWGLRAGVRMLVLEGHVRARQGDPHGAAESIRTIVRLGESLENEPLLVSQLLRTVFTSIAVDLLGRLLPHVDFSDDDLDRLQAELEAVSYDEGTQRAMIGERVIGIQVFQNPAQGMKDLDMEVKIPLGPRDEDLLKYLELMNGVIAATKLDGPEQLEAAEQCDEDASALTRGASVLTRVRYALTMLMTPACAAAVRAECSGEALRRAAVARIAVQRYRRKHGKLPEELKQIVPEFLDRVPSDPYDGEPLRYVVRDGEPVIYSIGKDRTDDGGQGDAGLEPDILFPTPAEEEEGF